MAVSMYSLGGGRRGDHMEVESSEAICCCLGAVCDACRHMFTSCISRNMHQVVLLLLVHGVWLRWRGRQDPGIRYSDANRILDLRLLLGVQLAGSHLPLPMLRLELHLRAVHSTAGRNDVADSVG